MGRLRKAKKKKMNSSPGISDKALRNYAFRVLKSEKEMLKPGTTDLEIQYFVDQLSSEQLTTMYAMFFETQMVQ